MLAGCRLRLLPTKEQEALFWKYAGTARYTYNACLAERVRMYEDLGETVDITYCTQYMAMLADTDGLSWLKETPVSVKKQAIRDLDSAYKRFFKLGGYPKFKKKSTTQPSFYLRVDKEIVKGNNHIKIEKISSLIKVKLPKGMSNLPTCKLRNTRVIHDGKFWFLTFSYDVVEQQKVMIGQVLGVDLGIKNTAIVSDGRVYTNINNTKRVKQLEKRLKYLQRKLSNKYEVNGSYIDTKNIKKLKQEIKLLHRKLKNIRLNHTHNITADLVKTKPSKIVIEDLNVKGMMKNCHLAKAIQKQNFYTFRQQLEYKGEYCGIDIVKADRFYPSSKKCSNCGEIKKDLKLSEREYTCKSCGLIMDRDLNASINLSRYKD